MKKSIVIVVVIVAGIVVGWLVFGRGGTVEANVLDGFAQCLTEKGFTMYGAYWCPHCQNERAAFGASFKRVNYVECTKEPNRCVAVGIKGYPTWITDDGRRLEGEQGIDGLAKTSGCSLNNAVIPASAEGRIRPLAKKREFRKVNLLSSTPNIWIPAYAGTTERIWKHKDLSFPFPSVSSSRE